MNKEVPLKERIEKLYESGYVNEFNYLENQLQEARYLVTILHKQVQEKDKEIEKLKKYMQDNLEVNEHNEYIIYIGTNEDDLSKIIGSDDNE